MDLVLKTVYFSIFMQLLTGIIQLEGIYETFGKSFNTI